MGKIIEIKTEHVIAFKTLIELLKDILQDVNIEIKRDDVMNEKALEEKSAASAASETELAEHTEVPSGKKKKKAKDDKHIPDKEADEEAAHPKEKKEEGHIKILAIDESNQLFIKVKLDAKEFHTFWCKKKIFDIGVNLSLLYKFMKSLDKDGMLSMFVDSNDRQNLVVKVEDLEKDYESTYKLKLMDIDKPDIDVPALEFDSTVTIETSEFHRICRDMNNISEIMEITCSKKKISFRAKGDSSERCTTYDNNEKGVKIRFSAKAKDEEVRGIYELKFLVQFTKCSHLCSEIQIFMKNNQPMCIKYMVATLGKIFFCLSPKNTSDAAKTIEDDHKYYTDPKIVMKSTGDA